MYLPDANLVLNLLRYSNNSINKLPKTYREFLRVSRNRVFVNWKNRKSFIPVNPCLAVMELTKQSKSKNYSEYVQLFNEFFKNVYQISNYSHDWVFSTYESVYNIINSSLISLKKTIILIYSSISNNEKPTDDEIIDGCKILINSILLSKHELSVIGGPLLYVGIFAIAGSPDARQILKFNALKKKESSLVAENVAWDFLYLMQVDISYYSNNYANTILCTSDKNLNRLISSRKHEGPRYSYSEIMTGKNLIATGDLIPFKLNRLRNTKLEITLMELIKEFHENINSSINSNL